MGLSSGSRLYSANKAWVHGFSKAIAIEHGSAGIRCNMLAPTWARTATAYMAGPGSAFVNGRVLAVDGGSGAASRINSVLDFQPG
ncbi:MAG: SDR family oxidoreductase [Rhodobacteraceae bacterium]|nr:SDR family oxidoreductase [Paracoccaceae bacterium]